MSRILLAAALLCALASPSMAGRRPHHPVCPAVEVEGIPVRICPPARRR